METAHPGIELEQELKAFVQTLQKKGIYLYSMDLRVPRELFIPHHAIRNSERDGTKVEYQGIFPDDAKLGLIMLIAND